MRMQLFVAGAERYERLDGFVHAPVELHAHGADHQRARHESPYREWTVRHRRRREELAHTACNVIDCNGHAERERAMLGDTGANLLGALAGR